MNTVRAFLQQNRERLGLGAYDPLLGLEAVVLTPRFEASRHVVFLLLPAGGSDPVLVAKIPRLTGASTTLQREAAGLQRVQALRPGGFASVPRLVAFEEHCARPILVETALAGPLMSPDVVRRDPGGCCRLALEWLVDLQQASVQPWDATWFNTFVERPLDYFARRFPVVADDERLLEHTRALVAPLQSATLPFVCEHGDLSHPNLILCRTGGLGVVDWELGEVHGLLASDVFVFLTYVAFSLHHARTQPAHLKAFHEAFFTPSAWTLPTVQAYQHRLAIPHAALTPLFVLSWAHYTIGLLLRLLDADLAEDRPVPQHVAAFLRGNRYYRLWCHAVANADRLSWRLR